MSLDQDRERIVEQLSAHYAEDHLSTQELERRFEAAYKATTQVELQAVVSGLPALAQPTRVPAPRPSSPERRPSLPSSPTGERRYLAFMSNFRKAGNWTPNRSTVVRAIMADVKIDLRDATFVDSEIDFDVFSLMSDVTLLVPPGVRVECDGLAIMGEFADHHDVSANDPDGPLVRVRGSSVMAKVSVETRMPGETRRQAAKRAKLARQSRS